MAEMRPHAFRMIGDIYYVGIEKVSSHLIASKEGHILLDACMPDSGPAILANIAAVGLDPKDVRYLLITHAHIDHLGSAKFLAERTGAKIAMHAADIEAARNPDRSKMGLTEFEPFEVDLALVEGEVVAVGDKQVQALHTPGHTPGCLSFTFPVREAGKDYASILFGGPGTNVFEPKNLARGIYGGRMEDFLRSLDRLAAIPAEVWLGAHPNQNRTFEKHQQLLSGRRPNPYIDPQGWRDFIAHRLATAKKLTAP